jgi:hypothetical protein
LQMQRHKPPGETFALLMLCGLVCIPTHPMVTMEVVSRQLTDITPTELSSPVFQIYIRSFLLIQKWICHKVIEG